ncbi:MAG TPA: hypothetical protein PLF84_02780 [Bryobacteraceae bacterium]|nr:hypothetical protein [Bryobacteraceae bacterium]
MTRRHMKMSDVEAQKTYPFRTTAKSFLDAYPTVKSIRVEVRPVGEGFEPYRKMSEYVDVYNETNIPAILNCRNPRCFGGGLDLDNLIRWSVVEGRLIDYEDTIRCQGYEGSPKGRRRDGPCDTSFKLNVSVAYKDDHA